MPLPLPLVGLIAAKLGIKVLVYRNVPSGNLLYRFILKTLTKANIVIGEDKKELMKQTLRKGNGSQLLNILRKKM